MKRILVVNVPDDLIQMLEENKKRRHIRSNAQYLITLIAEDGAETKLLNGFKKS